MMRTSILDRRKRCPLSLEPPAPLSGSISHDRASGVDRFDQGATGGALCAGFLEAVFDCAACHIERGVKFFAGIAAGDFQDDRGAFDRPLVEMARPDCPHNSPSGRGWEAPRPGVILRDIIDAPPRRRRATRNSPQAGIYLRPSPRSAEMFGVVRCQHHPTVTISSHWVQLDGRSSRPTFGPTWNAAQFAFTLSDFGNSPDLDRVDMWRNMKSKAGDRNNTIMMYVSFG